MSKTIGQAFLELAVGGIPVPPPRVKMTFDKIKINKIMEEKRKHPATVVEMALQGIKSDTPLHEMVGIVKDALETYGYKDEPKVESALLNGTPLTDGMFLVAESIHGEMGVLIYKEPIDDGPFGRGLFCHAYLGRPRSITKPYYTLFDYYATYDKNKNTFRLATPEEKQLLLDELAKGGYQWDEEQKKVAKLRWKPELRETYYSPLSTGPDSAPYVTTTQTWMNYEKDKKAYEGDWVFQTQEECDTFCQKLNEAIQNVKRE